MKRPMYATNTLLAVATCICTRLDPTCAFVPINNGKFPSYNERIRHHRRPRLMSSLNSMQDHDDKSSVNIYLQQQHQYRHRREFSPEFQLEFEQLLHWRRDVRHFQKNTPVDETVLQRALSTAFNSAPSVGLSQPWRIVRVESDEAREAALRNFEEENAEALRGYNDNNNDEENDRGRKYARLKLSGMKEAPVQLAIFCDESTTKGAGLGAQTMPEMRRYSVVSAITSFWLTARSVGIGVGWVSILDAKRLSEDLGVEEDWVLVGYLCVGYPEEEDDTPELERCGWEMRMAIDDLVITSL